MIQKKNKSTIEIKKKLDETRNYFIKPTKRNDLISKKYKNVYTVLNYIENLLILATMVVGCVLVSVFASSIIISIGIASSAVGLEICVITARIKNYVSIIKRKRKRYDKIVLLAKDKLNSIEVLNSKDYTDP